MRRRVVITSAGVVSALGFSTDEIVHSLKVGGPTFIRPSFTPEVCVCPVDGRFNLKDFTGRYKNARYLNRGAQFCVASAIAAVRESGLSADALAGAGLFVGTGPNLDIGGEFPHVTHGALDSPSLAALWILRFLPNTAASAIADIAGIHGENATIGTACSASLQAVGEGFRRVSAGFLDVALAGGGDSRLSPGGILAYRKAQALWAGEGDPTRECGPFDRNRRGFVPGEGGAFFLLEALDHAKARGAIILAEICGFGASMDGCNMTAPEPAGAWAETAVLSALKEAGVAPQEIDAVSAHGTATTLNDEMEAGLIGRLFSNRKPPVIALKSWVGHLAAACGAVELAIGLSCLRGGFLPEIRNLRQPAFDSINLVRAPANFPADTMLFQNFGFGGQNAALVVKKWKE